MFVRNELQAGECRPADPRRTVQSHPTTFPLGKSYSQLPFFSGVDEEVLYRIERLSIKTNLQAGQNIYFQDDLAHYLYIVVAGHVRISYLLADGSTVLHDVVPPGEVFGELGFHEQSTHSDMATAIGPVVLMSIPLSILSDHCRRYPTLAAAIGRAVVARYRDYLRTIHDLSLQTLQARLARTLIRLADRLDRKTVHLGRDVQVIDSMVTQTDLGLMARGSRGNVNRTLQLWQRLGWILLRDRAILIVNKRALADTVLDV